jgi:hypothetical protein
MDTVFTAIHELYFYTLTDKFDISRLPRHGSGRLKPALDRRSVHVTFGVDKRQWATGFSDYIGFPPAQVYSTIAPYSPSCTCSSYQKDKREKAGNLPKSNAVLETEKHWTQKYFRFAMLFFPKSLID